MTLSFFFFIYDITEFNRWINDIIYKTVSYNKDINPKIRAPNIIKYIGNKYQLKKIKLSILVNFLFKYSKIIQFYHNSQE